MLTNYASNISVMDELHHLIDARQWVKVRLILSSVVDADDLDRRWEPEGFSALDCACRVNAPRDVLVRLHEIDPYQVRRWNMEEDRLVLHTACVHSSVDAVILITDVAPEIATWRDGYGRTPLHEISSCTPAVARALLVVHPTAVYASDARGERPTQRYLREEPWCADEGGRETLSLLLRAHALGADYHDDDEKKEKKRILLHELIKRPNLPQCMSLRLMKEVPEYLLLQDDEGNFPLHVAAKFKGGRGGTLINSVAWSF